MPYSLRAIEIAGRGGRAGGGGRGAPFPLIPAKRAFSCLLSLGSVSRRRNNATVGCLEVHKPDPRGKAKSKTRSPSRRLAAWILSPIGEQRRIN